MATHGWIGVDLDMTLAQYTEWVSEVHIGAPIPRMVERVKAAHAEGVEIRIVTARVAPDDSSISSRKRDVEGIRRAVEDWVLEHCGFRPKVQHYKDYAMTELWDDRAKQVIPGTGVFLEDRADYVERALRETIDERDTWIRALLIENGLLREKLGLAGIAA